ncbi:MAG: bifunctional 2-polyprenyl-6-hydroxyphenol methylase/3-demethylubiquinol 3-O-methyltransferase UbiG [bacterium]
MTQNQPNSTTIDPEEVAKFSAMAAEWWDPFGKFKPLHKMNPIRLGAMRDDICTHFNRDRQDKTPLAGLNLIDIGCGGGLVCEPMRRLGATVTGIDAAERNVKTATAHAAEQGLDIVYRHTTVEDLAQSDKGQYDIVLNLEVVEHVADVALFLEKSASLVKPGGIMIVATLNRTAKAFLTAKFAAEYILRWLPAGTHDPRKFLRPAEIKAHLINAGLIPRPAIGISYAPLTDMWRLSPDISVNYMMTAERPALTDQESK